MCVVRKEIANGRPFSCCGSRAGKGEIIMVRLMERRFKLHRFGFYRCVCVAVFVSSSQKRFPNSTSIGTNQELVKTKDVCCEERCVGETPITIEAEIQAGPFFFKL